MVINPTNYTLTEGSTIISFSAEYLNTLGDGEHELKIVSKKNVAKGSFNVTPGKTGRLGKGPYLNKVYKMPLI